MPCWTSRSIFVDRSINCNKLHLLFYMSYDWDIHQEPYLLKLIHFSKRDPHHTEIKVKPSDHVYPIDPKNKTMFECIAVKEIIFCQLPCDALLLLNSLHKAS